MSENEVDQETDALRRHTRTGRPLGDANFLDRLESLLDRSVRPKRGGRPRK